MSHQQQSAIRLDDPDRRAILCAAGGIAFGGIASPSQSTQRHPLRKRLEHMNPAFPRMMHICFYVQDDVDFNRFIPIWRQSPYDAV